MTSSLQIDGLGSSTAVVSWDETSDGSVYTLYLQDSNGNTLTSIETQETSATFQDLTPSTKYVFQLYVVEPETTAYKSIRLQGTLSKYITLVELQVYDGSGVYIKSDKFTFESTGAHSTDHEAKEAMNGNTNVSAWQYGALVNPSTGNYWQANYAGGTEISKIMIYHYRHATFLEYLSKSLLILTDVNNNETSYALDGVASQTITVDKKGVPRMIQ